ncbi:hypothetical protein ES288_D08G067200v1 [Gossypium darwinii]|uniref:Uncharacterized protein n=2 Tax=Gossypium TaxID=3633 RepID=A0A5D2JRG0_GOSTO|nr:hypothetical protein ES288_D08G067200v1 [Gossypium darwinii]TYH57096.1 hypothetical protein ES332_D08G065900v1 [Gossypium tomentosum]
MEKLTYAAAALYIILISTYTTHPIVREEEKMGGYNEKRGLFLVIVMLMLMCTNHCFAAAVKDEGLVEMETSLLFPDGSSEASFLGALRADSTCGRRGSNKCTPGSNQPIPPPPCGGGSFNRNC